VQHHWFRWDHRRLVLLLMILGSLVLPYPALAAERVPFPVWIFLEAWTFIGFVAFVPLSKLALGAVLTIGGAFLPDMPDQQKTSSGSINIDMPGKTKVNFRGTPRYAVLGAGIIIVLSSFWDGVSNWTAY
jgi:hypothetical protein